MDNKHRKFVLDVKQTIIIIMQTSIIFSRLFSVSARKSSLTENVKSYQLFGMTISKKNNGRAVVTTILMSMNYNPGQRKAKHSLWSGGPESSEKMTVKYIVSWMIYQRIPGEKSCYEYAVGASPSSSKRL